MQFPPRLVLGETSKSSSSPSVSFVSNPEAKYIWVDEAQYRWVDDGSEPELVGLCQHAQVVMHEKD